MNTLAKIGPIGILCAVASANLVFAADLPEERVNLPTRSGVTAPVYITATSEPKASVILLPGHGGIVAQARAGDNFLVRAAPRFVAARMTVAMVDPPSDHAAGMSTEFRASLDHATDIAAVAGLLSSRSPAPVWLVGTSLGSISAAEGAAVIGPPRIAGVVLTSSPWQGGMAAVKLDELRVPVLVVHNPDDGCYLSQYRDTSPAMARIGQAKVKELISVSGGSVESGACEARSPHGFYGIEDQVVPRIIAWIESHQPREMKHDNGGTR